MVNLMVYVTHLLLQEVRIPYPLGNKIREEYGVLVVTSSNQKVKTPAHVDPARRQVFMDDYCEIPMRYLGTTELGHEFGCDAAPHECFRAPLCPQYGKSLLIPVNLARFRIFFQKSIRFVNFASIAYYGIPGAALIF